MLDRELRTRLGALAETAGAIPDLAARDRIVKNVLAQGPALIRRGRMERTLYPLGAFALAASVAVLVSSRGVPSTPPAAAAEPASLEAGAFGRGAAENVAVA